MERVEFAVEGSRGDTYSIAFEIDGESARAFCTCPAGDSGQYCKHRFALMDGDVSDLLSGNTADVARLKNLLQGTDLAAAYDWVLQAEAASAAAKKELDAAKKALTKVMYARGPSPMPAPRAQHVQPASFKMNDAVEAARDIEGTGIKAGDKGKVIYVQNGTREIGRSTDLSPHAFQVRFPGGAEIWMTADEIALAEPRS